MFIFDKQVFVPSAAFLLLLVGLSALSPEAAGNFFQSVQNAIVAYGSWYYVLVVAVILIVVTILTFTKFGDIKLGPDPRNRITHLFLGLPCCLARVWALA